MHGNQKIISARITDLPQQMGDRMPEIVVTFEGGTEEESLFEYYPDEISFEPDEFIGLTFKQACRLKFNKDIEYLTT